MRHLRFLSLVCWIGWCGCSGVSVAADWPQWRGPTRDGRLAEGDGGGPAWPAKLDERTLTKAWSVPLGPSYSGPIVVGDRVFTTETHKKSEEVVRAYRRSDGQQVWEHRWVGSLSVPFFAKENGDWIRSTPAFDRGGWHRTSVRGGDSGCSGVHGRRHRQGVVEG